MLPGPGPVTHYTVTAQAIEHSAQSRKNTTPLHGDPQKGKSPQMSILTKCGPS